MQPGARDRGFLPPDDPGLTWLPLGDYAKPIGDIIVLCLVILLVWWLVWSIYRRRHPRSKVPIPRPSKLRDFFWRTFRRERTIAREKRRLRKDYNYLLVPGTKKADAYAIAEGASNAEEFRLWLYSHCYGRITVKENTEGIHILLTSDKDAVFIRMHLAENALARQLTAQEAERLMG